MSHLPSAPGPCPPRSLPSPGGRARDTAPHPHPLPPGRDGHCSPLPSSGRDGAIFPSSLPGRLGQSPNRDALPRLGTQNSSTRHPPRLSQGQTAARRWGSLFQPEEGGPGPAKPSKCQVERPSARWGYRGHPPSPLPSGQGPGSQPRPITEVSGETHTAPRGQAAGGGKENRSHPGVGTRVGVGRPGPPDLTTSLSVLWPSAPKPDPHQPLALKTLPPARRVPAAPRSWLRGDRRPGPGPAVPRRPPTPAQPGRRGDPREPESGRARGRVRVPGPAALCPAGPAPGVPLRKTGTGAEARGPSVLTRSRGLSQRDWRRRRRRFYLREGSTY